MQRAWKFIVVLGMVLALTGLIVSPVHAAKETDPGKEPTGVKKEEKKSGPQIFTPVRLDLTLWTLVVFLLLCWVLKKYAWAPILGGLQKREGTIQSALDEAQRTRAEAQRLREDLQGQMNRAHETVRELLEEARRDSQHTKDEMMASARNEIQAERDRLRREIGSARDQALQEIWKQAGQLATQISSKVIRRELNGEDHRRLVDEALTELGQANVGWKERNVY